MLGTVQATMKHAVNRLLNPGWYRVVPAVREDLTTTIASQAGPVVSQAQPYSEQDLRRQNPVSPQIEIKSAKSVESPIAGWHVYGVRGLLDIRARDPDREFIPVRGLHGPTPARFTFLDDGTLIVEQSIVEFWGLLDRELTFSALFLRGSGDVSITVDFVFGTAVIPGFSITSTDYAAPRVVPAFVTAPYDATEFTVRMMITGRRDQSVLFGEFMLQLGHADRPRFTDDLSLSLPRAHCALHSAFPAPVGFITLCELDGRFLYPSSGDALVEGINRRGTGGSSQHRHTGKTSNDITRVKIEKGGQSYVSRKHRHAVDFAEVDPLWVRLLLVQKL